MALCTRCGRQAEPGAEFCSGCGGYSVPDQAGRPVTATAMAGAADYLRPFAAEGSNPSPLPETQGPDYWTDPGIDRIPVYTEPASAPSPSGQPPDFAQGGQPGPAESYGQPADLGRPAEPGRSADSTQYAAAAGYQSGSGHLQPPPGTYLPAPGQAFTVAGERYAPTATPAGPGQPYPQPAADPGQYFPYAEPAAAGDDPRAAGRFGLPGPEPYDAGAATRTPAGYYLTGQPAPAPAGYPGTTAPWLTPAPQAGPAARAPSTGYPDLAPAATGVGYPDLARPGPGAPASRPSEPGDTRQAPAISAADTARRAGHARSGRARRLLGLAGVADRGPGGQDSAAPGPSARQDQASTDDVRAVLTDEPMLGSRRPRRDTSPSQAKRPARPGRLVTYGAAAVVLVIAAISAVILLASHGAPGGHRAGRPTAARTRAPKPRTTAGPLITVAPAVAGAPQAAAVGAFLTRYFTAINDHDYAAYRLLFSPKLRGGLSAAAFTSGYGSSQDSGAVLRSIAAPAAGQLQAAVSFVSHQQPADSATRSTCTAWTISLYLVKRGTEYVLESPPAGYRATATACS
jgi:hypothetical protein